MTLTRFWHPRITLLMGLLALGLLLGCSDKGNNATAIEESLYPEVRQLLNGALGQFCININDALEARYETDTALIPGLVWPEEVPPRHRSTPQNFADTSTSWYVVFSGLDDTINYGLVWKLGRYDSEGTMSHLSPDTATRVEHDLDYTRVDGSGEDAPTWRVHVHVTLRELDSDTLGVTLMCTARWNIGDRCSGGCEDYEIALSNGRITRVGDDFDASTLTGDFEATLERTEFGAIVGIDARYVWQVEGAVTSSGPIPLTVESGQFSRTENYDLCP